MNNLKRDSRKLLLVRYHCNSRVTTKIVPIRYEVKCKTDILLCPHISKVTFTYFILTLARIALLLYFEYDYEYVIFD